MTSIPLSVWDWRYNGADMKSWSKPVTLVPAIPSGDLGVDLVHLAVGAGRTFEGPEPVAVTECVLPRIAAGDPAAVPDCITRYGGLVWSLARRFLGNAADAEDAVQDVFIELWKNAARFDPARGRVGRRCAAFLQLHRIDIEKLVYHAAVLGQGAPTCTNGERGDLVEQLVLLAAAAGGRADPAVRWRCAAEGRACASL